MNTMSNTKTMGGPAFPIPNVDHAYDGMTLRDYFAAKAMHGILRNNQGNRGWSDDMCAEAAYEIADAMLKAREQ
jgi:hypothetical protein